MITIKAGSFAAFMLASTALTAAPFRTSNDGGATWTEKDTLAAAYAQVDSSAETESIIELCEDHTLTTSTLSSRIEVARPFVFRSQIGASKVYTLTRSSGTPLVFYWTSGVTVTFTNLVVSGGTKPFLQGRVSGVINLCDGFKLTGCETTENAPIVFDNNSTLNLYDGAEISDCSGATAGGIFVGATFNMYGGTVTRCSASGNGGGIAGVDFYAFHIRISGGTISACTASGDKGGGGLYIGRNTASSCVVSGGTITGNKAKKGGGIGFFSNDASTCPLQISGTPVVKDNTLLDGTTPSNVQPLSNAHLVLTAPLLAGAELGVTRSSGTELAAFGLSEIEQKDSGSGRIFFDGNPVGGKTRTGCVFEGSLIWVNEGEDPATFPFRVSTDGGATWTPKHSFKEAITAIPDSGTPESNLVELQTDAQVTDADTMGDKGNIGVGRHYTLRSKGTRKTLDWSSCTTYYFMSANKTHSFTNVVITGMSQLMQARLNGTFNFYDGVLFTNNADTAYSPVYADSGATISIYPGAVFCGNRGKTGGAIGSENGTVNMYGGVISNNVASSCGGGIAIGTGGGYSPTTLNLFGGLIADNTAPANAGDAISCTWRYVEQPNEIHVSGAPVVRGMIYLSGDGCTNNLVQVGDLGPTAELPVRFYNRAVAAGGPSGRVTGDFTGAEQIFAYGRPAFTAKKVGGRLCWTDAAVIGPFDRASTGDATVSKLWVKQMPDGFGTWTVDGTLTISAAATADLSGLDGASLAARKDEAFVLAEATAIAGSVPHARQSGAPAGWVLRRSGNQLVLVRSRGLAVLVR